MGLDTDLTPDRHSLHLRLLEAHRRCAREGRGGPRMKKADIDTTRFLLPVVDVNDEMLTRPDPADVAAKYRL